tara:strand:- start:27639 stop:27791 length:153 start_codon:yes stop_codon:yes gene_type:complete
MPIDMTPSRAGYIYMLKVIVDGSTKKKDIAWAKAELQKIENGKNVPRRTE